MNSYLESDFLEFYLSFIKTLYDKPCQFDSNKLGGMDFREMGKLCLRRSLLLFFDNFLLTD